MSLCRRLRRKLRMKKKKDKPVPAVVAPAPQVSPENDTDPTRITSQQNRSPYSVTIEERIRYQRVVLGMTDDQIRNALPPGHYDITLVADSPSRPSGPGDIAYVYMEPAR
ncbi:uncharacterized protein BP5553_08129 [Venustampulla echinocandica]|uniref:Uncharacterized protein n=1 Tax=Venustampulla echinocandica TaxID=2656787 RepID=A0A370TFW0_9HELO|nr:uncharacterized protein BP5553_08129 [Venustampulla echinocandica]RDL33761.1 hypothetical protein BP5553_08129 [Venustampulla echinocandica]